jgi:hypothetical protein
MTKRATRWMRPFEDFLKHMRIDSKEVAAVDEHGSPLNLWGSQQIFLDQLAFGLEDGQHAFFVLKARQLGISTISLAIDIFWCLVHPGMMGALVTDTEANRNIFRATIERYIKNLPVSLVGENFKLPRINRDFVQFPNGSRLDFLVAGTRSKATWGEGRGYTLAHLTEVANYGDPNGLASFRETLSETHPNRLTIYESTAKGFNHWKDMWDECARDPFTKRGIFAGWWAKDLNRIGRRDRRFQLYGQDAADGNESELINAVRDRFGVSVDMEQLAWIRWRTSDQSADVSNIAQNLPWVPEQAFIFSGFSFFQTRLIARDLNDMDENEDAYAFKAYRYWIGTDFFATKMEQLGQGSNPDEWELRVWEEPVKGGQYVIGCDPAFGRNDWRDKHAISIWRCYADKLVQVAEYASHNIEAHQCAWVLAHLASAYKDCIVNLELSGGPGKAIMREFDRLRGALRQEMYSRQLKEFDWEDVLNGMRWYLYHRPDSLGAGYVYNFLTTRDSKFDLMNRLRSAYTTRVLQVRSRPLLGEMQAVVQEGSTIEAPGREKDDRVVGAALANFAWDDWVRPQMIANGMTYERVKAEEAGEISSSRVIVDRLVYNYFQRAEELANADPRDSAPKFLIERGLV